jgi:hypothetical protein
MRKTTTLSILGATSIALSLAHAADPSSDPYGLWKPLQGAIYKLHSGIVADRTPPTSTDRRLTIIVDGKAAKDIFNSLGPDLPETCSSEQGDRLRDKKIGHSLQLYRTGQVDERGAISLLDRTRSSHW